MGILRISFPFILIVCDMLRANIKMRRLCVGTNLWNIKNVDGSQYGRNVITFKVLLHYKDTLMAIKCNMPDTIILYFLFEFLSRCIHFIDGTFSLQVL